MDDSSLWAALAPRFDAPVDDYAALKDLFFKLTKNLQRAQPVAFHKMSAARQAAEIHAMNTMTHEQYQDKQRAEQVKADRALGRMLTTLHAEVAELADSGRAPAQVCADIQAVIESLGDTPMPLTALGVVLMVSKPVVDDWKKNQA